MLRGPSTTSASASASDPTWPSRASSSNKAWGSGSASRALQGDRPGLRPAGRDIKQKACKSGVDAVPAGCHHRTHVSLIYLGRFWVAGGLERRAVPPETGGRAVPKHDLRLSSGVSIRRRSDTAAVAGEEMLLVGSTASAWGRDQCSWVLSRNPESAEWYAGVMLRTDGGAATGTDCADAMLGPVESELQALRLVADQLAAYLAAAMRSKAWYEPDPDLPDGGLSDHLLHDLREARLLDHLKSAFDQDDTDPSNN